MTTLHDQARAHLEAVQATQVHLDALHERAPEDRHRIAAAYDRIRQGLKLAEVKAQLSIAEQLEQLNTTVTDWLTDTPEFHALLEEAAARPLAVVRDLDQDPS